MDTANVVALAFYAFIMSITPGPNNLMLASSGLTFGMTRTWPHVLGILFGVIIQLIAVGLGLGALFAVEPRIHLLLKFVGTLYLLWLAWKLWGAARLNDAEHGRPITFLQATAFQFVNPKAWVIAVTVIAAFVTPAMSYAPQFIIVCSVFVVVGLPCMFVWVAFGASLRKLLHDPRKLILVNRTMAILAALSAGMFWF